MQGDLSDAQVLLAVLAKKGIHVPDERQNDLYAFISGEMQSRLISQIKQNEGELMSAWILRQRIIDIDLQSWVIPNATVGKDYKAELDVKALKIEDVRIYEILGLKDVGLSWDAIEKKIIGVPTKTGMMELTVKYSFTQQNDTQPVNYYSKKMHFVINPDPRTLWKNIPSDQNAPFWKEDNAKDAAALGSRNIVVSSKRGRSHQHKGTFRDDHHSFRDFGENGWSVVAVSDGAGSASYSREGSKIACEAVVAYFQTLSDDNEETALSRLDAVLASHDTMPAGDELVALETKAKTSLLYPAAIDAHESLKTKVQEFAASNPKLFQSENALKQLGEFHATLIFCLFKRFKYGYVFLTFGVGDCPIAVCYADTENAPQVELLNVLDVGEYGGGTRFITQPHIFYDDAEIPMTKRTAIKILPSFDYLFLMTDGIYDPKFEVEANLEKVERWMAFISDLRGENEDEAVVVFDAANQNIDEQLSIWMDFFSKGNHDDRTLAVIY